jgi:hypothetical protein
VRYGLEKITRYNENSLKVGEQGCIWDNGDTWDNGETWDNATWDSFELKCKGSLRFLKKKCHNF